MRRFTTPSDREIGVKWVADAPRRLVFEAWTNPKHLPHWMLGPSGWTMPVCQIDLHLGGAWHFVWRRSDGTEMARWIAARRPIRRGVFLVHGEEEAIAALAGRLAERIVPAAKLFQPLLDDIYELSTPEPALLDVAHRRRLAPEAVTHLDWHNDMSTLVLDINDRIAAAADDRARGVIIRRLRRALEDAG